MAFNAELTRDGDHVIVRLEGELDTESAADFHAVLSEAATYRPQVLILRMGELEYLSPAGVRGLAYARQRMGDDVEIVAEDLREQVEEVIRVAAMEHAVIIRTDPARKP